RIVVHALRPWQSPAAGWPRLARRKPAVSRAGHEPGDANPAKWRSLWARSGHPRHCRHPGPHETWTEYWLPRLPHPASDRGQGLVVMTNSDNGSILAETLIRRAAQLY